MLSTFKSCDGDTSMSCDIEGEGVDKDGRAMTPVAAATVTTKLASAAILFFFSTRSKHLNVSVSADEAGMHTATLTPAIYARCWCGGRDLNLGAGPSDAATHRWCHLWPPASSDPRHNLRGCCVLPGKPKSPAFHSPPGAKVHY